MYKMIPGCLALCRIHLGQNNGISFRGITLSLRYDLYLGEYLTTGQNEIQRDHNSHVLFIFNQIVGKRQCFNQEGGTHNTLFCLCYAY